MEKTFPSTTNRSTSRYIKEGLNKSGAHKLRRNIDLSSTSLNHASANAFLYNTKFEKSVEKHIWYVYPEAIEDIRRTLKTCLHKKSVSFLMRTGSEINYSDYAQCFFLCCNLTFHRIHVVMIFSGKMRR